MSLASIHPLTTHRIHLGHLYVLFEYIANYLNLATWWYANSCLLLLVEKVRSADDLEKARAQMI